MSQFKVGDKVVRMYAFQDSTWSTACARKDVPMGGVFVIDLVSDDSISVEGLPGYWGADCFRAATGLEEPQDSALPAADRLREYAARIECLLDLLEAERQRVAALQAEVSRCCGTVADKEEMQRLVAALERDLDTRQNQLDVVMKRNNALSDQIKAANDQRDAAVAAAQTQAAEIQRLQQQVAAFQADVGDAIDLAEAARHTARTLGNEVQELRMERREYRHALASFKGPIAELRAGVEDIDTGTLSSQLDQIGRMADEQGNGADAKLCFDASQVLDMVERFLSNYDAE